jgi:hypothetical protein
MIGEPQGTISGIRVQIPQLRITVAMLCYEQRIRRSEAPLCGREIPGIEPIEARLGIRDDALRNTAFVLCTPTDCVNQPAESAEHKGHGSRHHPPLTERDEGTDNKHPSAD